MNDQMRRFIVAMMALAVSVMTSVAVMIKGWGLEPKSWFWIVGIYLFGQFMAVILTQIAKSK